MKVRGKRALLNLPGFESTAAIVFEIQDTRQEKSNNLYANSPEYVFQLSDCSRSINFEFDFRTPESQENNLYKVDTMIEVLKAGRRALVAEHALYNKRTQEK
jgi:hypothetical protein